MGRSRGGLTTKVHALVDGRGLPLQPTLIPGQAGDCPEAAQLLSRLPPGTILLADKAYDANWPRHAPMTAARFWRAAALQCSRSRREYVNHLVALWE